VSNDSVLYTIGTALRRAEDSHSAVHVLVEGQWIHGRISAVDGYGLVLESVDATEHSVVRMASISAVRVSSPVPAAHVQIPEHSAMPMGAGAAA
jgi:hypothetical protein